MTGGKNSAGTGAEYWTETETERAGQRRGERRVGRGQRRVGMAVGEMIGEEGQELVVTGGGMVLLSWAPHPLLPGKMDIGTLRM